MSSGGVTLAGDLTGFASASALATLQAEVSGAAGLVTFKRQAVEGRVLRKA